jgi:MFS family permease
MSLLQRLRLSRQGKLPSMTITREHTVFADGLADHGGQPTPVVAIASIILSMWLVAIGNGLMFAYIPVRLGTEGYDPTWAGLIITGLSAGGLAACLLTGPLVRRVGHARAFMVLSALIALSNAAIGAGTFPVLWIGARALYGFAICGLFIVAQSWLNDVVANAIRGRVMAVFYVAYTAGLGVGYYSLALVDIEGAQAALIGIAFTALSILPVGLTRLAQPPAPRAAALALRQAWRISPVGVIGMLAVGGLSMSISGFAPIHATAKGYSQKEVALLLSSMPIGTILMQIPFGWISDRTDRRYVLIGVSALATAAGLFALGFDHGALAALVLIYVIWDGASESIYSLSSAHAADRAGKEEMVALSSSLLFAWSLSGFLVPAMVTGLTALFGTQAFIYAAVSIAAIFCLFVSWRITMARPVPAGETGSFAPMTAQAPLPVDLAFTAEESAEPLRTDPQATMSSSS